MTANVLPDWELSAKYPSNLHFFDKKLENTEMQELSKFDGNTFTCDKVIPIFFL